MSYCLPVKIYILTTPKSQLIKFWQGYISSSYFLNDIDYELIDSNEHSDFKRHFETAIMDNSQFEPAQHQIYITDIDLAQSLAVSLKLKRKWPVTVMKWWDNTAIIKKTKANRRIFNRHTGVNIFQSQKAMQESRSGKNGCLIIDNPYLIDQAESLGEDSKFKMVTHAISALSKPTRKDGLGNIKQSFSHINLCVATHFYCNQDNINSVTELLAEYEKYPPELLDRIQFILVDDGSPIEYEIPKLNLNITWLKINEDIRWNQAGARNLAMLYAKSNNVIISDSDHMFPEQTLDALIKKDIGHKRFYKFYRKNPDGSFKKGHPNIFYLARSRWFQLFGTDEEYAGAYGAEDFRFVKSFKNHGTVQRYLPKNLYCIDRKIDRDKSYHSLIRDLSFNTPVDTRKRIESEYFGANYGHSRSSFNYTWEIKKEKWREITSLPPLDKGWRARWNLRQLKSIIFPC